MNKKTNKTWLLGGGQEQSNSWVLMTTTYKSLKEIQIQKYIVVNINFPGYDYWQK